MAQIMKPRVAVLIPCYNEEVAIGTVIAEFRAALPDAQLYVGDNNSTDRTGEIARAAGATTFKETYQGKGHVVRRLFSEVDADIYVLVDGDATYDAASAPAMIEALVSQRLDMVNGARISDETAAYRSGHRFGNWLLTSLVAALFGNQFHDMLSGYRVFSRRFVKSFPALARGFETETELTVHALQLRMPIAEVPTAYRSRPPGSLSKLSTFRDGWRILCTIGALVKQERPLLFFGGIALVLALASLVIAIPVIHTYFETRTVPRLPTAVLSTGLMLLAALSSVCGLILETVTRGRLELKRLTYLSIPFAANANDRVQ